MKIRIIDRTISETAVIEEKFKNLEAIFKYMDEIQKSGKNAVYSEKRKALLITKVKEKEVK